MNKIIKTLIIKLLFFLFVLNNSVFSKPLPPGSGAGDVPVNILLLLDSSQSMSANPFGGDALSRIGDVVLLNDGSILVGQIDNAGIVKMDYTNEELDTTFANNKAVFYGGKPTTVSCELDGNQVVALGTVFSMAKSSSVDGVTGEVIYATGYDKFKVAAIDPNGNCIEIIWANEMGRTKTGKLDGLYPTALTIRTIDGNDHLIVTGKERWCKKYKNHKKCKGGYAERPIMYSRNLTTGEVRNCALDNSKHTGLRSALSLTMDDENLYFVHASEIYRISMAKTGGTYCPSTENVYKYENFVSEYNHASQIEIDPQDDDVMYVTSNVTSSLQKLEFSADRNTLTESLIVGGTEKNIATPSGAADANLSSSIAMYRPHGLFVGNDRVWTGGSKITIQEYDISGNSIKWKAEMGTERINRMKGAQKAIEAVVTDSAFLQTANFGYGHWNAGERFCRKTGKAKDLWKPGCQYVCNKKQGFKGRGRPVPEGEQQPESENERYRSNLILSNQRNKN